MQRGFKTQCERLAIELRQELTLSPTDPINPWKLAEYLEVLVWNPADITAADSTAIALLTTKHRSVWSAATVYTGSETLIILNSAHAETRQANSLAHELSHIICDHQPAQVIISQTGELLLREYDQAQEEEADWMAGTLLLPRNVLLHIVASGWHNSDGARRYGVSKQLLDWRVNKTGVLRQLGRGRPINNRR